jgi:hypothetical protein
MAEPEIVIENVLSRMLELLSVTLTVNVEIVSCVTRFGVPLITPLLLIDNPEGNIPLNNIYVTLVAGNTADAESVTAHDIVAGNIPKDPADVFHIGCAILMCA